MGENFEQKPEIEKPSVLYHASRSKNVTEFEPRAETVRIPEEGPLVFGTPDVAYASCFIVPTADSWTQVSVFDNSLHVMIISDQKRFKKLDKGGSIYFLPSDSFETDPEKSPSAREWTSKNPVKPSDKKDYKSGLQAMLENGVEVYFVEKETFDRIQKSDDHGLKILKTLKPYENKFPKLKRIF